MTVFAMTEPALLRLFERLDFAPQPKDQALSRLFERWQQKRNGRIAPTAKEMGVPELGEDAASAFMLQWDSHQDEPELTFSGAAFDSLMGPCDPGAAVLIEAPERRNAARLRRLGRLVKERAEPVLAEFDATLGDDIRIRAEIVLTPLSSRGKDIDGLFGGVAVRHHHAPEPRLRHAHRIPSGTEPLLFSLKSGAAIGQRIAQHLGQSLQPHEERDFEDGEHKSRPLVDVRGRDVIVFSGLHGGFGQSVNDRLCRLLFFIGALKDAGARHVTVITPYLCYARKDRRTKTSDPVTTRYVGQLFEAIGTDRLITMEVHNLAAFENAFRLSTTHLNPYAAFGRHIAAVAGSEPVAVVSPDIGGAKRAELFRQDLEDILQRPVSKGIADKQRSMGRVTGDLFAGDVSGCTTVILDDLISTGTTMARVAQQCRDHGATHVIVAATHGVGGEASLRNLTKPAIDAVILANTIPQTPAFMISLGSKLTILDVSDVFAQAIGSA
ncbi:ribose-phosphate pyrophosphokinase [Microvirga flocculans]|uniref:ribose-phosphate diphosphokinase n=1 Tax=Microvirga flocculans TaxID=217168 RepID=A0A7W6N8E2_9HYPH|nr:ribose-phosphate diphosphokinase [Microvirga flocculans]MBB4040350.1 ribose-phosphate pyrophosphokinase [Microvirga flocculans]